MIAVRKPPSLPQQNSKGENKSVIKRKFCCVVATVSGCSGGILQEPLLGSP